MIRPKFRIPSIAKSLTLLTTSLVSMAASGWAQIPADQISPKALRQIRKALSIKESLTSAEAKISSNIMLASRQARFLPIGGSDKTIDRTNINEDGLASVQITGKVSARLVDLIKSNGGEVLETLKTERTILARVPLAALATIAADSKVQRIDEPDVFWTNVGAVTSQAYISHKANLVVEGLGVNGAGVKVGVLSDSATAATVAALQASGDLPAGTGTTVITPGTGHDEGCAMMEIIHDLAPGAQVSFNTGTTATAFAAAITALSASGCKIIVDDISFASEGVFQDDVIARAVNAHVSSGGIYFSSAANSGNLDSGTGGTWEGDFLAGPAAAAPVTDPATSFVHNFGTAANPVYYDTITAATASVTLKWSDPLGASANDYDLFVLDGTGNTLITRSITRQAGTGTPYERVAATATDPATGVVDFPVGSRVVIVQYNAATQTSATRALHLDANRGAFSLSTRGNVFGHNGGANTQSVAATFWNSGKQGTVPFTGAANPVELFSSDGPRRIFYNPNGTLIGTGTPTFANTTAGTTLLKPDFTAADGVTCKTAGFSPFFGTSAAAPHAAAIAALMLSANPALTNTQMHDILVQTAQDNMASGFDPDGGYGVLDAQAAVNAARALITPP